MTTIRNVSSRDTAKFAGLRVLLVDDHPQIRSILTGILNALGIVNVTTAERGDLAVLYLAKGAFDLLITDFEMPGMSGTQIAKAVRNEARLASPKTNYKIPILMITGNVTRERLNEARDAGIDEILAKPFTVLAVADRLNAAINKRREFIVCESYVGPCRRRNTKTAYVGPKRRDSDLVALPALEVEQERQLLANEARSLCSFGTHGDTINGDLKEVVFAIAMSAARRSKRIRSRYLERAFLSLAKYVQWGSTGTALNTSTIVTHGEVIFELLAVPKDDHDRNNQIVQGLEDNVRRVTSKRAA